MGSGIFVLVGQIAATTTTATWTWCSFAVAGVAATCSGCSFAELASRGLTGSTYGYCQVCWGQGVAVVAAACLTLEYAVAGAAVARSWGDKLVWMWQPEEDGGATQWMHPLGGVVNIPAGLISAVATGVLLAGVRESKFTTNFLTLVKMLLVAFMIVAGFWLSHDKASSEAVNVESPGPSVASGILRGATSSFFGYLGYDEVCCIAAEAKHPARDMPRAVLGTLAVVTVTYILASLALTGMVDDVTTISPTSGFPSAFAQNNVTWAADLTAWGEVLTLPVVVLISLLAQPRLTFSMAQDGLLPPLFSGGQRASDDHNPDHSLFGGTAVAGAAMTLIATTVPFTYLDDLISAGILVAFSLTNSSLVLLRRESPQKGWLERCLTAYNVMCLATALLWSNPDMFPGQIPIAVVTLLLTVASVEYMARQFPSATEFGGSVLQSWEGSSMDVRRQEHDEDHGYYFQTPCVPYLPCFAMAINWYLIAQLEVVGLVLLVAYLGAAVLVYGMCGCRSTKEYHSVGVELVHHHCHSSDDEAEEDDAHGNSR